METSPVDSTLNMKAITLAQYDILISGPVHNLLAAKAYDRLHVFKNERNEEGEFNILGIEWKRPNVAEIHAYWRNAENKEVSGLIYYFSDCQQGVVLSIFSSH